MENLNDKKCTACSFWPPDWRYKCQKCRAVFTMPAPRGPADEKNRKCPECGGAEIQRTDLVKSEACPPGG
ncbi:MAG: hypothetical protein A2Y89_00430 [Chloroflexi bacterium RBG_13_51_18]|nr:MAG: hypothetical protein A2Y89_00430 [Chloroflexi bacterium RBG_13_51_18]